MSEQQLRDLLARSAAGVPVSPPPVAAVGHDARRRRTRRRVAFVAVVLPVAGAAVAVAALGGGDGSVQPAAPTRIDLPISGWEPGSGGDDALLSGVLDLDRRGCVVFDDGTVPTWPRGWTAVADGDGFELRDQDGDVVAHDGDRVQMGGGFHPPADDHPCTRGVDRVAVVQSEVTVVEAVPLDLPTSDWDGAGAAMTALISGPLRTDRQGCLLVGDYVAVWPAGFTAVTTDRGVELRGPEGELVAREGDRIESGGGYLAGEAGTPCTEGRDEVAYVQSEVVVVP